MDVRPQQRTQIHADAERVAVEMQRNAAAKAEFEIQVTNRFVIDTRVEAVVASQVRAARGNAGGGKTRAVRGSAGGAALGGRAATKNLADQFLTSPRTTTLTQGTKTHLTSS